MALTIGGCLIQIFKQLIKSLIRPSFRAQTSFTLLSFGLKQRLECALLSFRITIIVPNFLAIGKKLTEM